jgi:hypothetical protein
MNVCQRCLQNVSSNQKFCPGCGSQLSTGVEPPIPAFSPAPNQYGRGYSDQQSGFGESNPAAQQSTFGNQPMTIAKDRTKLYIGLGVGALAMLIFGAIAIGGGIYWYSKTKIPLAGRFSEQVTGYKRGEMKTTVSEDLKKDSVEALVTTYSPLDLSSKWKSVTFVAVRYPSKERAELAVQNKVRDMQQGTISRATIAEAGNKKIKGSAVGLRTVLTTPVMEQIVWNENEDFMLITSSTGGALEFVRNLLNQ